MHHTLPENAQKDLISRGYSRRQFGRIGMLLGLGGALAATPLRKVQARSFSNMDYPPGAVRLGANEFWTGPFPQALEAGKEGILHGNRYLTMQQRRDLLTAVSAYDGIAEEYITPWPGSSDPLSRSVVTFASPRHGVVTCDPTYEQIWETSSWLKIPVKKVPLRAENGYKADVKAMLAANPDAGLFYICSPNNPTGTLTPLEDIEWLVRNKPASAMVVVDEAYLHFSDAPSAVSLVKDRKDVIVLRTFSKLFGMAGLRLGLSIAHPDVLQKMMRYDGAFQSTMLSLPAVVMATESLKHKDEIAMRKAKTREALDYTVACLKKRGIPVISGQANMLLADWKQDPARIVNEFRQHKVFIGRSWTIWPHCSRITIGSEADMKTFCAALDKITI